MRNKMINLLKETFSFFSVRALFVNDAHKIISAKGKKILAKDYNPYCPVCESCGEDGCCSALSCKQDPNGSYCETCLKDLKFGYLMYKDLHELVSEDPKYSQKLEEIFDRNFEGIYNRGK